MTVNKLSNKLPKAQDYYNSIALAYLEGHKSKSIPVFKYITETSFLISADCFI